MRLVLALIIILCGASVDALAQVHPIGFDTHAGDPSFGCEANPTGNPIGGGEGYSDTFTTGEHVVTTAEELLEALGKAQAGEVVFVPDGVKIDLTDERSIAIPGRVTLAGTRGLDDSEGARLFVREPYGGTLFVTAGHQVRITGLRIEGPFGGTEVTAYSATGITVRHFRTRVDNCEVYNWNVNGISISHPASQAMIHHNYIHHCRRRGLGYGVVISSADAFIIANIFEHCRHLIACTGRSGSGYEAAWNRAINSNFDMHGGRDLGDGTNIAGDWLYVHHNTFEHSGLAVSIRGIPSQGALVHNNWFGAPPHMAVNSVGNTHVYQNVYGPDRARQETPLSFWNLGEGLR